MTTITVFGFDLPHDVTTLEGFRHWVGSLGEDAPTVHFSRGRVFVEMSAQDYDHHQPVVSAFTNVLGTLARRTRIGRYFEPPSWVTVEESGLSTEPDGFLVARESFAAGSVRVHPTRRHEMIGRPDMTLEVVSKTSARKDLVELVDDYARAGVPEYWIADARHAEPRFRILVLGTDGRYADQEPDAQGWLVSPGWGHRFRLRRFVDEMGLVDFELDHEPLPPG